MSTSNPTTYGGPGLATLLTVAFVVMKLLPHATPGNPAGHIINWSWWWVLSPIWISFGLFIAVLLIFIIVEVVYVVYENTKNGKR